MDVGDVAELEYITLCVVLHLAAEFRVQRSVLKDFRPRVFSQYV